MGQKFAAFDTSGNITAYFDDVDSPVPAGATNTIKITDAQWQACISTPGYTVRDGALIAPTPPTAAQIAAQKAAADWATYVSDARSALNESDVTVLRCYEDGIALPSAWVAYRKALRAIVSTTSGDATKALPTKPPYPSGS